MGLGFHQNCRSIRFDASSNLTEVWDGRSNITRFHYGPNDEPTGVTWPDEKTATANYDASGRIRQTTDERGIVANYVYNAWGQLNVVSPHTQLRGSA